MGISMENPDPSKQAQEFVFSRKIKKPSHLVLILKISINSQFCLKLLVFFLILGQIQQLVRKSSQKVIRT